MATPSRPRRLRRRSGSRFERLVRLMQVLRAPGGCPWDRKQTHATLRSYLLEETYEVLDAIDRGDVDALAAELGDVLLQVVFHAEMGAADGRFDINDVIAAISEKLVRRHPHVFTPAGAPLPHRRRASGKARTPAAVVEQWEQIKTREQTEAGKAAGVLAGIPRALPALIRAHKLGARVAAVGFDWPQAAGVVDKIEEEVHELRAAIAEGRGRTVEEMGDLLFSIANLARKLQIDPESALRLANDKFAERFAAVEAHLARHGRTVHDTTTADLEAAWQVIKRPPPRRASSTSARSSNARPVRGRRSQK